MNITNRVLENATGFSHTQIKRWAVAFLHPDKASGQHSGIPRLYTFEQAFRIFLGGYLVRDLKFTLIEARQILDDIDKWLKTKGWRISKWIEFRESKLSSGYVEYPNFPWLDLRIDIGVGSDNSLFYISKIIKERVKKSNIWTEKYELGYFGKPSPISKVPLRSIDLGAMVGNLANMIAQCMNE